MRATWKPHEKHGELTERGDLPSSVYAFPNQRKEPMTDASHVRNAIARFDQVTGVADGDRELAFANIKKAARHYGVAVSESEWEELGRRPSTGRTAAKRRTSASKAAATRNSRKGTGTGSNPARKRGAKRAAATRKKNAAKRSTAKAPPRKKATRKAAPRKKTARKKTTRKKTARKKTTR